MGSGSFRKEAGKDSELIDVISTNKEMVAALGRLKDLLLPFAKPDDAIDADAVNETVAASVERERHISLLHKSVDGLKANLELTAVVAAQKAAHQISDNATLLKEVNRLRHELRQQSMENQRLVAQHKLEDVLRRKASTHSAIYSSAPAEPLISGRESRTRPAAREADPSRQHDGLVVESEQGRRRSSGESLQAVRQAELGNDLKEPCAGRSDSRSNSNPSLASARGYRMSSVVSLDDSIADSAGQVDALFEAHIAASQPGPGTSAESKIDALMAWNEDYLRTDRATTPDNVLMQHQNKHMLEIISRSRGELGGVQIDPPASGGRGVCRSKVAGSREAKASSREIVFPEVPTVASGRRKK